MSSISSSSSSTTSTASTATNKVVSNPLQPPSQQQQHKPTVSLDEPAYNLSNLANLDRANFFSQQQQMRAEAAAAAAHAAASESTRRLSSDAAISSSVSSNADSIVASQQAMAVCADLSGNLKRLALVGGATQSTLTSLSSSFATTDADYSTPTTTGSFTTNSISSIVTQQHNISQQQHLHQHHHHQSNDPTSGHFFAKKTFHKPTYCHHCSDLLWGLIGQGYYCDVCNFVVHERCMRQEGISACSTVATQLVKNPTPHCWITDLHPKRKFCNVCRKRIDDNTRIFKCTICEYNVHVECIEYSLSNCRECATFVLNQRLDNVTLLHHWREGNLPTNSTPKCAWCRLRCNSIDCLTGLRCEWCQTTAHAGCVRNLTRECNLGSLQSIMLPPYCVSIPRTDFKIETIIGIRQKLSGANLSQSNQMPSNLLEPCNVLTINANALHHAHPSTLPSHGYAASFSSSLSSYAQQQVSSSTNSGFGSGSSNVGFVGSSSSPFSHHTHRQHHHHHSSHHHHHHQYHQHLSQHSRNEPNIPSSITNTSNDFEQSLFESSDPRTLEAPPTAADCSGTNYEFKTQQDLSFGDDRGEEQNIRIFDGNSSIKRLNFRWISIFKNATRDQLVSACLRTFHVYDENLSQYALIDISDFISNILNQVVSTAPQQSFLQATSSTGSRISGANQTSSSSSSTFGPERHSSINQAPPSSSHTTYNISSLNERELDVSDEQYPILAILKRMSDKKAYPSILIRFKPFDDQCGIVKVFPGKLNLSMNQLSEDTYVCCEVQGETTVDGVIADALIKFNCQNKDVSDYKLVELSLDKASSIHERTMDNQECPWEIIKNFARDSIRQKKNMRFYLHQKSDVSFTKVQIYIGNMPTNLKQTQYEQIITERLPKPYRFKSINPIYYEHGGCVLTYDQADIAVRAYNKLDDATFRFNDEERKLVAVLLPNLYPELIPAGVRPLLVFVNVRSGGRQGFDLLTSFRRLLNPFQVYDLENGGPLPGLYAFRKVKDYRILILGGDGSVGWVLQCLDNVGQDSVCQSPPCAIIPLGTGNDLARVLRWGTGYSGNEDPISFLKEVMDAEEVILDRWTVVFHSDEHRQDSLGGMFSNQSSSSLTSQDNSNIFVMNNYFGIGLDAELCLDFHNSREENPYKFNSRLYNKGVYVKQALRKIVHKRRSEGSFNKEVMLEVDGIPINYPLVEGIIILNIASWGSGANPWGIDPDDRYSVPAHHDGLLEVVGVSGVVHMGQIQSGISRAHRIAQGSRIKVRIKTEMAIQVDGEPWIQPAGEINILRSALKANMLRRIKMRRRNTEPSIQQEPQIDKSIQREKSSND